MGALIIALLISFLVADGYILLKMWEWFLEPIFHAKLSILQAMGITVLFRFLVLSTTYQQEQEEQDKTVLFVRGLVIRGFALFLGYFLHLAML